MIRTRLSFGALSVLLLLAFCDAVCEGRLDSGSSGDHSLLPILVALGAGATLGPRSEKLCKLAGNLSYPLYMTHYAVIWSFGSYYRSYKPDAAHLALVVTSGVLIMVSFAYLVMMFYDIPVRRYLAAKTLPRVAS